MNEDLNKPMNMVWFAGNSGGASLGIYIKTGKNEECNKTGGG